MESPINGNGTSVPTYAELFPPLPEVETPAQPTGAWVKPVLSSTSTEIFTIPFEEQRFKGPGSFGENPLTKFVKEVCDEHKVNVDLVKCKDQSLTVSISGRRGDILEAKKSLLKKVQTQAFAEIAIPKEHHRFIIGKDGKRLKDLQDATATQITIPKNDDPSNLIKVQGTTENVKKAAQELQIISEQQERLDAVKVPILRAYHPLVLGVGNKLVKELQDQLGVKVYVPPPIANKDEIGVSGEKAAVARAQARLLDIYEEKKRTCGEITANIRKSQHKYIIGPKGVRLNDIFEKTGVYIEVPEAGVDSETITLRGAQPNLVVALQLVYEEANKFMSDSVSVPQWLHRHLIGPKGATLETLVGDTTVYVSFKGDSNEVEMEGPSKDVLAVKQRISALAQDLQSKMTFVELKVAAAHRRHLIGRGGQVVNKLRGDHNIQITIPDPEDAGDIVRIEGAPANVKQAKAAVEAIVHKLENTKSVDVIVPRKFHAQLVGKGGASIKEIAIKFPDIVIDIPHSKKESDIIVVRGDRKEVDAAEKHIQKLVKGFQEEGFELAVPVFKQFHKNIIGKGGSTINQLKEETKTRFVFPDEDSADDCIIIIGKESNCKLARDKILKIQDQMANMVTEEITIDPKYHNAIIGPKGKVLNSIVQQCGGVNVRFPTKDGGKDKQDKVVIRGPKEDVELAKVKLLEYATEKALESHHLDVSVPRDQHKFLIGRGGSALSKIQDETQTKIIFPTTRSVASQPDADPDVVTIIGKQSACEAARDIILKRVEELKNTVEVKSKLENAQHKALRSTRLYRELADEGVQVFFPKEKDVADEITLRGSQAAVTSAIDRINEFVDDLKNQVTVTVDIPAEYHGTVMGKGGVNVRGVSDEFRVNIKFPERRQGSTSETPESSSPAEGPQITVSGRKENCEKAIAALKGFVPISVTYNIPAEYHGQLIGPKGETVKKLRDDHGANLKIPPGQEKSDTITLVGTPSAIESLTKALDAMLGKFESEKKDRELRSFKVTTTIDSRYHGVLVGKFLDKLQKDLEVQVTFPKSEPLDEVVITGYEDKAKQAAEALQAQIKVLDGMFTVEIKVNSKCLPRLIGKKGASAKKIQDDHNVKLDFYDPKEGQTHSTISIFGPEDKVNEVRDMLVTLEEEIMESISEREASRPSRPVQPAFQQQQKPQPKQPGFSVAGAPWNSSDSFPTLGASKPTTPGGAWGKKN